MHTVMSGMVSFGSVMFVICVLPLPLVCRRRVGIALVFRHLTDSNLTQEDICYGFLLLGKANPLCFARVAGFTGVFLSMISNVSVLEVLLRGLARSVTLAEASILLVTSPFPDLLLCTLELVEPRVLLGASVSFLVTLVSCQYGAFCVVEPTRDRVKFGWNST